MRPSIPIKSFFYSILLFYTWLNGNLVFLTHINELFSFIYFFFCCIQGLNCNESNYDTDDDDEHHLIEKRKVKEPFTCPHDGYFPDPDNCSKYYLCSGASLTQHDCGEGLSWDAELQLCGWSNTIDCKNGNRPWEKITDMNGSEKEF